MKEDKFKKAIQDIQNARMTTGERQKIFAHIVMEDTEPFNVGEKYFIPSPWNIETLRMRLYQHRWLVGMIVLMLVVGMSDGIADAAERSLPGSILYPIKVAIVEPLRDNTAHTPEAKAEWEIAKAERRLSEAEALAAQGKLDTSTRQELADKLNTYAVRLNEVVAEAETEGSSFDTETIEVAFEAGLNAHATVLNEIASYATTSDHTEGNALAAAARTHAENIRRAKSTRTNGDTPVATMAFSVAPAIDAVLEPAQEYSATSAVEQVNPDTARSAKIAQVADETAKDDSYMKIRASAVVFIDTTTKSISSLRSDASAFHKKIASTSEDVLIKARESLHQADLKREAGDEEGAHSLILESERAAREASIILKEGLKLDDPMSQSEGKRKVSIDKKRAAALAEDALPDEDRSRGKDKEKRNDR